MKRLIQLSAEEEQPFPSSQGGGGGRGDCARRPRSVAEMEAAAFSPPQMILGPKS